MTERKPGAGRRLRLAKREAKYALIISLVLGFAFAFVQIIVDYQNEKKSVALQLSQLVMFSTPSATEAVWSLSSAMADGVTEGLLSHPLVTKAVLKTNNEVILSQRLQDEEILKSWSDDLTFLFGGVYDKAIFLDHADNQSTDPIGILVLTINPRLVRAEFSNRVVVILLSGVLKALFLGAALLTLFYFTLAKPIELYARWLRHIDPKEPESWDETPPEREHKDELHDFGQQTSSRFKQAGVYFKELQQTRGELIQLNSELEARVHDRTQALKVALDKAEKLATTDDLTGLSNRRSFMKRAEQKHAEWVRYGRAYALLMIDLDNFKYINDHFGHSVGDHVLKSVAQTLTEVNRKENAIGRLGGEEFCILMPGMSETDAVQLAERLRASIESLRIMVDNHAFQVTASFGLLPPEQLEERFECGLKNADVALYASKHLGRNQVSIYRPEMQQSIVGG